MAEEKVSSFTKSLFMGEIAESMTFPYPEPSDQDRETIQLILENLRRFAKERIHSEAIDAEKN